jgi:hypothetical protein
LVISMTIVTESQWLEYFGFERFPFDRPEAGNEEFARPEFLASCFVEPRGFERVFGQADSPVTSLLFAARGTGKTACRVMMDYYCRNGLARLNSPRSGEANFVLSIPHIRLDNVREIARQSANNSPFQISLEHHVHEIMRRAVPAFVELIAGNVTLADKVGNLSATVLKDLYFYIALYSQYLTAQQKEFLMDLGIGNLSLRRNASMQPVIHMENLEKWAKLMTMAGIKSTYVMIDGVDELMESASDPHYAYSLVRPLLDNLRPTEINHLALKFFLPSDLEPMLASDSDFRPDRVSVIERIEWKKDDLVKILRERLNILRQSGDKLRDRTAAGFDALCSPGLRGQVEENMISIVKENPRRLMNFCASMITSHCSRDISSGDDLYYLNRQDFENAKQIFEPPPVIRTNTNIEVTTDKKIKIADLILQGETETLEFKSSIRYDYKKQAVNKDDLGLAITKTLAGFMNRIGGILIIGVNDDGQILGLKKDFETLAKKNVDGFQLAFKDIVKNYLSMECLIYMHLHFEILNDDRVVCAVVIDRSSTPVYLKNGNDNEFYVRMLNSTLKLSLPETVNYIRSQWG